MAFKRKIAGSISVDWQVMTWNDYWAESRTFAKALHSLKVNKFEIVNILGFNSPEWFVANMGTIMGGGIAAGLYNTSSTEACMYISQHSKAVIVVVDDKHQLMKYMNMPKGSLPYLKAMVVWGEGFGINTSDQKLIKQSPVPIYTWREFMALGEETGDPPCPGLIILTPMT